MLRKIRIVVSVNQHGQWSAYGRWNTSDSDALEEASGNIDIDIGPISAYFVEIDVEVPTAIETTGTLVPVKSDRVQ